MKKILAGLLFLVCMQLTASSQKTIKDLVGRWETSDGAGIEVIDSSKIFLVYGKEKKQISSLQADFSKTPCWFDFTIKDSTENISMKSLLLFVNNDLLQWQVFEDVRPNLFSKDKGEMVYLRRKK